MSVIKVKMKKLVEKMNLKNLTQRRLNQLIRRFIL